MDFDEILKLAISELEELFGQRDQTKVILPVETHDAVPQVFYPSENAIKIFIGKDCIREIYRAYYQIGHEAVHLLSPVAFGKASVLEEGIAVWFSHKFMTKHTGVCWETSGHPKYDHAWHLVRKILRISNSSLRNIRLVNGGFSPIDVETILKVVPTFEVSYAHELAEAF